MEEIWKDVIGYEGHYKVSNLGRVKSKSGKILKPAITRRYYRVSLSKNNITKNGVIHILVAESFLGHVRQGMKYVINHKNFNKLDNRVENLEIVTQRENGNKKHIPHSSKYTGVSWCKEKKKWFAIMCHKYKRVFLGRYENELDAAEAYNKALAALPNVKQ